MGTWDPGIFDNDDALDLIGTIMDDLQRRLQVWFDEEEPHIDEGEGLVPPIVAVMHVLSTSCGAAPPKAELISKWKTRYMKIWDSQIDDILLDAAGPFKNARREVLTRTFKQLETAAKAFWGVDANADADEADADEADADEADADEADADDTENMDSMEENSDDVASSLGGAPESSDKRRFEFVDGKSNKYWEIQLHRTSFTVSWGRIGTAGQTQTKDFPTEGKAQHEYEKLVEEKLKKGYEEIE